MSQKHQTKRLYLRNSTIQHLYKRTFLYITGLMGQDELTQFAIDEFAEDVIECRTALFTVRFETDETRKVLHLLCPVLGGGGGGGGGGGLYVPMNPMELKVMVGSPDTYATSKSICVMSTL